MDIPGFYYFEDIITPEDSEKIVEYINNQPWKSISASKTGRKVQQYGYEYDYVTRKDTDYKETVPIPDQLLPLQKIGLSLISMDCKLNQCIINMYTPGQGISAHIDKETFGPAVVCFTFCAGTTIIFTRKKETIEKYVKPGSVYIMTQDARYEWKHEIKPKMADNGIKRGTRISVTFRSV